jgi:ketol-acid reductoisomerase
MARFYGPSDFDPEIIKGLRVGMLGYGSQGQAQAQNLRDSGVNVAVGLYEGSKSAASAQNAGFSVVDVAQAVQQADLIVFCVPDVPMSDIYKQHVAPHLRQGQTLLFAHGFNIHYGLIQPPPDVDVVMVSPKGAGHGVRSEYESGRGVPALVAIHQDFSGNAESTALSYAWALGCARSVVLQTTFAQETITDLFGEQAVLCGGMIELIKAGFHTLVENGYEPEAAYFECLHETKLIIDLLVAKGLHGMRSGISDTAEWGGYLAGERLVNDSTRNAMREMLQAIEDGSFAQKWVEESRRGAPELHRRRQEEGKLPIEEVGAELRTRMNG